MQLSQNKKKTMSAVAAIGLVALGASSCGGKIKPPFEQARVAVRHVDQNIWMDFSGVLKTGNLNLPSASYSLVKNGHQYGTIELRGILGGGGTQVVLSLNFTEVTRLRAGDGKLPNGLTVPIAGVEGMTVVDLAVGGGKSRVYVGFGRGGFIGYTLVIPQLDSVGRNAPPYHAFLGGSFEGIAFSAGMFAGPNPGESGIGVFADISNLLGQASGVAMARIEDSAPAQVQFANASKRQINAVTPKLQRLLRNRVSATIQ